jgi:sterol 3beta-glucosyltransferase
MRPGPTEDLTSSIHAIHRPVQRARTLTLTGRRSFSEAMALASGAPPSPPPMVQSPVHLTDEEAYGAGQIWDGTLRTESPISSEHSIPSRTRSSSNSSQVRKADLAEKLREVFGLESAEKVLAGTFKQSSRSWRDNLYLTHFTEYPCWLLRSVLLEGYLYLTQGRICFFSYLPSNEGTVVRSGTLSKKAARTRRYVKHW